MVRTSTGRLGLGFIDRVREVFDRIASDPQRHAAIYLDIRKASVANFPHVVIYSEDSGEIVVISVFHTSRDPSAWKFRA